MKNQKKLVFYGGGGYENLPEYGKYEVKASETKYFYFLSEARKYYDSLMEDKALWDINRIPELIDCHYLK